MVQWITTTQLAKELQVTDRTIRYWATNGTLPAHRIGRQIRFRRDEIDMWLSERRISRPQAFHWPSEPETPVGPSLTQAARELQQEILRRLEKRARKRQKLG